MKAIVLVLGLMFVSLTMAGQTLRETTDWMHSFTAAKAHWADRDGFYRLTLSFKGCDVSEIDTRDDVPDTVVTYSLSDIDPASIEVSAKPIGIGYVWFETTNSELKVHQKILAHSAMGEGTQDWGQWGVEHFDADEDAQRFAKAFRHAVALCGGKHSTF